MIKKFLPLSLLLILVIFPFIDKTESDTNLQTLAGTIRNSGTGWKIINDKGHYPINIIKVETKSDRIVIYHDVNAKQVATITVTPDETMTAGGYRVGVSGGLDYSYIFIYNKEDKLVNPTTYTNSLGNIWIHGLLKQ